MWSKIHRNSDMTPCDRSHQGSHMCTYMFGLKDVDILISVAAFGTCHKTATWQNKLLTACEGSPKVPAAARLPHKGRRFKVKSKN